MPEGTPTLAQETQQATSGELPVTSKAETATGPASFETAQHVDPDKAEERPQDEFDHGGETDIPPALPEGEGQE
jgi:hypothetical protein